MYKVLIIDDEAPARIAISHCEHSSQKAREFRREIMESMIFCVSRSMQL